MATQARSIADLSSLTRTQAETLRMEIARRNHAITMEKALKSRKISGISRGAYYRTVAQARENVKSSLFTVAFAIQQGLAKVEDVQKFIASTSIIPDDLNPEKAAEVLSVLNALAERIVMP